MTIEDILSAIDALEESEDHDALLEVERAAFIARRRAWAARCQKRLHFGGGDELPPPSIFRYEDFQRGPMPSADELNDLIKGGSGAAFIGEIDDDPKQNTPATG